MPESATQLTIDVTKSVPNSWIQEERGFPKRKCLHEIRVLVHQILCNFMFRTVNLQQMLSRRQFRKFLFHFVLWSIVLAFILQVRKLWHHSASESSSDESLVIPVGNPATAADAVPVQQTVPNFSPFEGDSKMLVILSYQRSGSTFFGRLFSQNPNVFYMFEPLDSVYSSLYGTPLTWNVPSDITSYKNGSRRFLPLVEFKEVHDFLAKLLSCDTKSLPAETLIHPFLFHYRQDHYLAIVDYIRCIEEYQSSATQCSDNVPRNVCGGRFGEVSDDQLLDCNSALHNDDYRQNHARKEEFGKYVECMQALKITVNSKCSEILETECKKRPVKAVKVVRATMDSVEPLLTRFPNVRIIHLLRDPRAVVRSRKEFHSSVRSIYSDLVPNNTLLREAAVFCRTLTNDVRARLELEKKYPGKIYTIIFDDMVHDFKRYATNVYRFLGLDDPTETQWYKDAFGTTTAEESIERVNEWSNKLSFNEVKAINAECEEFFQLVNYDWL